MQFQIGRSLAQRMEKPDRDQQTASKALQAFEDLLRLYPTSEYAAQAEEEILRVRNNLARHEYMIGVFYLRYGLAVAAVGRFEALIADFPDYTPMDKCFPPRTGLRSRSQVGRGGEHLRSAEEGVSVERVGA